MVASLSRFPALQSEFGGGVTVEASCLVDATQ